MQDLIRTEWQDSTMPSTGTMTTATKLNPLRVVSNDPRIAGQPGVPTSVICEFCGAERHTEGINFHGSNLQVDRVFWFPGGANPCVCPKARAQYSREQEEYRAQEKAEDDRKKREQMRNIVLKSGMGERFLHRTFKNYTANTPDRKKIIAAAKSYALNFDDQLPKRGAPLFGRNGFLITGAKGTGKTHIASAIANYLLAEGKPVICMTERNLFGEIQKTYTWSKENGMCETDVRKVYESVPLLIIDDLGKEKSSEWTLATLYAIIDGRYDKAMPLIITTNYDMHGLVNRLTPKGEDKTTAEAIVDRLIEMCECMVMTGESWRSR